MCRMESKTLDLRNGKLHPRMMAVPVVTNIAQYSRLIFYRGGLTSSKIVGNSFLKC